MECDLSRRRDSFVPVRPRPATGRWFQTDTWSHRQQIVKPGWAAHHPPGTKWARHMFLEVLARPAAQPAGKKKDRELPRSTQILGDAVRHGSGQDPRLVAANDAPRKGFPAWRSLTGCPHPHRASCRLVAPANQ